MTLMHIERKLTMKDMLGKLIRLIVTVPEDSLGTLIDLVEKIIGPDSVQWTEELKKFLRKEATLVKVLYTRLVSGAEILILEPTDGTAIVANADDIFNAGIDGDFWQWECNVPGPTTLQQIVTVHEMVRNATYAQIFAGLAGNLDSLCLTQAQIIQFVLKHRKWLRTEGYPTLFLSKVGPEYFVVRVYVYSDSKLSVSLCRFSGGVVWDAAYRPRVVIPQTLV